MGRCATTVLHHFLMMRLSSLSVMMSLLSCCLLKRSKQRIGNSKNNDCKIFVHWTFNNLLMKSSKVFKFCLMKQISNFNESFPQIQSLKQQHSNKMMMTAASGPFSNLLLLWKKFLSPLLFPSFLKKTVPSR